MLKFGADVAMMSAVGRLSLPYVRNIRVPKECASKFSKEVYLERNYHN